MNNLSIDIETFSSEPIRKSGLYRYAQSPDFDILLFGYSFDAGQSARAIDLTTTAGRSEFEPLIPYLYDAGTIKHAWNAAFEWYGLSTYLARIGCPALPIPQWRDTMLHALYCGLPGSLEGCGKALGIPEDKQKLATGKSLIRTFSVPRKPTARDARTRILPTDEPEKWRLYTEYNAQDVVTESYIDAALAPWPVPDGIQQQWELDLMQNARGVGVDMELVTGALTCAAATNAELLTEAQRITGLENPNSPAQLLKWIRQNYGDVTIPAMDKDAVAELLEKVRDDDAE